MRGLLAILASSLVVLAGCTGEADASLANAASPAASSDAAMGTIRGLVVDETDLPLPGVQVAIIGGADTTTSEAGEFAFANVAPGEHQVVAQQLGYSSMARKVTVVAGETVELRFVLTAIEVVVVYHETRILNGLMACVITVIVPVDPGYTSYACGDTAANTNLNPNNKIMLSWPIPARSVAHIAELDWTPQSAMADQLRFQIAASLSCSGPVCSVGSNYQTKGGPRPVVHRFDETGIKQFGKAPQNVTGRFTGGPVQATSPVRVILDQKFEVYLSDWFGEEPVENWTATAPR